MDPSRLRAIEMFALLPDEDLRRIAAFATESSVERGAVLLREGDYSNDLLAIEEGTVQVVAGGRVLAELGPGQVVGEIGVLEKKQRMATVTALTPMRVIGLSHWDLRRLPHETLSALRLVGDQRAREATDA